MNPITILLMSGLPLNKKTSFYRQLTLLGSFLAKRGIKAVITGPCPGPNSTYHEQKDRTLQNVPFHSVADLISGTGAQAAVLLGYPDQFPILNSGNEAGIPVFLWSQFSHTPEAHAIGTAVPVPLTSRTRQFLLQSDLPQIGPLIPHGVDTSIYRPLTVSERAETEVLWGITKGFTIGTVGANTSRKRFDRIIESFSLFSKKIENASLIIKTDRMVSADRTDLPAIAEKYGVLSRIKFIDDDLSDQQMRDLYGIMDVYLNLSEWEGFCIPIIEAMACGIPVVTLPVQGPGEIVPYKDLIISLYATVREGETQLLLADTYETARVLLKAINNPPLLKKLQTKGIREVGKKYDIRIVAQQWEKLIRTELIFSETLPSR